MAKEPTKKIIDTSRSISVGGLVALSCAMVPLVAGLVSIGVWVGSLDTRAETLEKAQADQEKKIEAFDGKVDNIETDQAVIKDQIKRIREDQKEQSTKLDDIKEILINRNRR